MRLRISLFIVLICVVPGQNNLAAAGPPVPDDIIVIHDIAYREGASRHWKLDLAMKKEATNEPRPGIVVIHGGGWIEQVGSCGTCAPGSWADRRRASESAITGIRPIRTVFAAITSIIFMKPGTGISGSARRRVFAVMR